MNYSRDTPESNQQRLMYISFATPSSKETCKNKKKCKRIDTRDTSETNQRRFLYISFATPFSKETCTNQKKCQRIDIRDLRELNQKQLIYIFFGYMHMNLCCHTMLKRDADISLVILCVCGTIDVSESLLKRV